MVITWVLWFGAFLFTGEKIIASLIYSTFMTAAIVIIGVFWKPRR